MVIDNFKGYLDGIDITKAGVNYLTYPSKNVLVHKGKVYTRAGYRVFGQESSTLKKIKGEFVWKTAKSSYDYGSQLLVRATDNKVQVYLDDFKPGVGFVDIYDINPSTDAVDFTTWIDSNTAIIKPRLVFVDGTDNIHVWNGAIAIVDSINVNDITIKGTRTLAQLGFDQATVGNPITVIINGTEYQYDNNTDINTNILKLTSTVTSVSPGDLIIAKPVSHNNLQGFNSNIVFNYKNHLCVASTDAVDIYMSNVATYSYTSGFDFTVPAPGSATAESAMFFTLDGFITAMHERKGILWVSTHDDWFKIEKLYAQSGTGEWAKIEKVESATNSGALPRAVSSFQGDIIFISQDKTIKLITDIELLKSDTVKLVSDDIESYLSRSDLEGARIYLYRRHIFVTIPKNNEIIMYDTISGNWQAPQTIPVHMISIYKSKIIGHANGRQESYELFVGTKDRGSDIEATIALPYMSFNSQLGDFKMKWIEFYGLSGYIGDTTEVDLDINLEFKGSRDKSSMSFSGTNIKTFDIYGLGDMADYPFAFVPFAGTPTDTDVTSNIKRFYILNRHNLGSFIEFRPIISIKGTDIAFQLTEFYANIKESDRTIPNDLFISNN